MKLTIGNVTELVFIGVTSADITDKDGYTTTRHYLSVGSNGDVGKLPCSSDVLNMVKDLPSYSKVTAIMNLDTYKKEFVVVKVGLAKEKKLASTES